MAKKTMHVSETQATQQLRRAGIAFTEHAYDYVEHGGTAESARQLGVDEHAVVKTLVMQDERARALIVLMHGDRQVSTKALARAIRCKSVEPCAADVAQRHSGYLIGGTSPSLLTAQWVTLLVLAAAVPLCVLAVWLVRGVATGVTRLAGARRRTRAAEDEETPTTPLQTSSVAAAAAAGVAAMAAAANVASAVSAADAGAPTGGQPRAVVASPFAQAAEAGAPLATQPAAPPKAEPSTPSPAAPVKFSAPPPSSPSKTGTLIFIRHGESTSNERDVLAGVRDVDLTRFGRLQARAAGADLKRAAPGVMFDKVYVSTLRRTARTARIALAAAGQPADLQLTASCALNEKSFGIFSGHNVRLLQRALGRATYDHLLHAPTAAPPLGEMAASVYARVADFYLAPDVAAGRSVLVVGHQYALEPLGLYLAGVPPSAYAPANLPNGKAMSAADLASAVAKAVGGWRLTVQHFGDDCVLAAIVGAAVAALVGVAASLAAGRPLLPPAAALTLIAGGMGVTTFYALLECDLRDAFAKCPRGAAGAVSAMTLARAPSSRPYCSLAAPQPAPRAHPPPASPPTSPAWCSTPCFT